MDGKKIAYIAAEHIRPHPDNPRKDLGDLSELEESIRKNGVMQNLTVIPVEGEPGEYMTIIGHRRYAAGARAGIAEFPCQIAENLTPQEQLSIMLEENMQRNDLTIWEQANGFQMMLDLGETEEGIAEKTGFSKTTVRRRLNIAKLDQKTLREKERDGGFQLSLKDLYELEKIGDVGTRNKILKEARDSRDLAWRAEQAAAGELRDRRFKKIAEMAEKAGIEKAPKKAENELWSGKWDTVKKYDLDKEPPKKIPVKGSDKLYYLQYYRSVHIIRKRKNEKKEPSPEEAARKERDGKKKRIKAAMKELDASRREFILNVIAGKIRTVKNEEEVREKAWRFLLEKSAYLSLRSMAGFFTGKDFYECAEGERAEAKRKLDGLGFTESMLVALHNAAKDAEIVDYCGHYRKEAGESLKRCHAILEPYGWGIDDEETEKILDGTHELYEKGE